MCVYNGIYGTLQSKREQYSPYAIGDIRNVSDEEWATHWRPHGSGWRNPSPNNIRFLERAYGGSDMAAIMQCSHFKSRLELYHQKVGVKPEFTRNGNADAKELGHLYETPTAIKYHNKRRKNGAHVKMYIEGRCYNPDGSVQRDANNNIIDFPSSMYMYRDGRLKKGIKSYTSNKDLAYPWALANCDGLIVDTIEGKPTEGILEIKTTSPQNYEVIENWKKGIVPEAYYWQIVYYMAILNVMFCDIVCSWNQTYDGMAIIRVYRDYDVESKLFAHIEEFDSYVEQGIEPDISNESGELLNNYYYELFGPVDKKAPMIELPEKFRSTILYAIQLEEEEKEVKKNLELLSAKKEKVYSELYPVFKKSTYGQFRIDNNTVADITLKTPMKRATFDEERFKKDYPTLYGQCMKFSSTMLDDVDSKIKKEYMIPAQPDTEDKSKHPTFSLKVIERQIS